VGRNMPRGTLLPTWTSCRACPRLRCTNKSIFLAEPPERSPPSSPLGNLNLYQLFGALMRRWRTRFYMEEKTEPAKVQLNDPLPGCWATSCSIRRKNTVPNPAPNSFCRGKNYDASVGRERSLKLHPE